MVSDDGMCSCNDFFRHCPTCCEDTRLYSSSISSLQISEKPSFCRRVARPLGSACLMMPTSAAGTVFHSVCGCHFVRLRSLSNRDAITTQSRRDYYLIVSRLDSNRKTNTTSCKSECYESSCKVCHASVHLPCLGL